MTQFEGLEVLERMGFLNRTIMVEQEGEISRQGFLRWLSGELDDVVTTEVEIDPKSMENFLATAIQGWVTGSENIKVQMADPAHMESRKQHLSNQTYAEVIDGGEPNWTIYFGGEGNNTLYYGR